MLFYNISADNNIFSDLLKHKKITNKYIHTMIHNDKNTMTHTHNDNHTTHNNTNKYTHNDTQ